MNILLIVLISLLVTWVLYASSNAFRGVVDETIKALIPRGRRFFSRRYRALLEEANDPTTAATRLDELSTSQEREVLLAVAKNPNSPPSTLLMLSDQFPSEVFENPALALILLEDPTFLTQFPERVLLYFLALPDIYTNWEVIAQHKKDTVRQAVAEHPNAPKQLKEALLFDREPSVRAAALKGLSFSPEIRQLLFGVGWHHTFDWGAPTLNHERLGMICDRVHGSFLMSVWLRLAFKADHKKIDPLLTNTELLHLADLLPQSSAFIMSHPNISEELLQRFSRSEDASLRCQVAVHPRISHEVIEALSFDSDEGVLRLIALNKETPLSVLERLAQHPQFQLGGDIARDRKLPEPFLQKLAQSL
jgi:hypothetical protein